MGRELKRVALDFHWPENKVWPGYLNPHYAKSRECAACGGNGTTFAYQRLGDLVSLLMLSGTDALRGECHPWLRDTPLYHTQGKTCGRDMAELTAGLAGRESTFMGHDSCDKWSATKKIIAAAGLPGEWGICLACDGQGIIWDSPADQRAADDWEESGPPGGAGYQIWETVSEGSPVSPVFATPEELARHMAGKAWGADGGSSYESWLNFIQGPGWALSAMLGRDRLRTGPDAALKKREDSDHDDD